MKSLATVNLGRTAIVFTVFLNCTQCIKVNGPTEIFTGEKSEKNTPLHSFVKEQVSEMGKTFLAAKYWTLDKQPGETNPKFLAIIRVEPFGVDGNKNIETYFHMIITTHTGSEKDFKVFLTGGFREDPIFCVGAQVTTNLTRQTSLENMNITQAEVIPAQFNNPDDPLLKKLKEIIGIRCINKETFGRILTYFSTTHGVSKEPFGLHGFVCEVNLDNNPKYIGVIIDEKKNPNANTAEFYELYATTPIETIEKDILNGVRCMPYLAYVNWESSKRGKNDETQNLRPLSPAENMQVKEAILKRVKLAVLGINTSTLTVKDEDYGKLLLGNGPSSPSSIQVRLYRIFFTRERSRSLAQSLRFSFRPTERPSLSSALNGLKTRDVKHDIFVYAVIDVEAAEISVRMIGDFQLTIKETYVHAENYSWDYIVWTKPSEAHIIQFNLLQGTILTALRLHSPPVNQSINFTHYVRSFEDEISEHYFVFNFKMIENGGEEKLKYALVSAKQQLGDSSSKTQLVVQKAAPLFDYFPAILNVKQKSLGDLFRQPIRPTEWNPARSAVFNPYFEGKPDVIERIIGNILEAWNGTPELLSPEHLVLSEYGIGHKSKTDLHMIMLEFQLNPAEQEKYFCLARVVERVLPGRDVVKTSFVLESLLSFDRQEIRHLSETLCIQ